MDTTTTIWLIYFAALVASLAPALLMRRLGFGRNGFIAAFVVAFVLDCAVDSLLPSLLGATPHLNWDAVVATPRWLLFAHWFVHSSVMSVVLVGVSTLRSSTSDAVGDHTKSSTGT